MRNRERLEKLFIYMEIYGRIFSKWLKYTICPTLFFGGSGVVVFLYVTFRHTNLPLGIYLAFPYCVLTVMGLLVWLSYDANRVIQSSREICLKLQSVQSPCFNGLTKSQREKVVRRALASRPCAFPVGIFSNFSLTVPIKMWEQILNQLVLLLSL